MDRLTNIKVPIVIPRGKLYGLNRFTYIPQLIPNRRAVYWCTERRKSWETVSPPHGKLCGLFGFTYISNLISKRKAVYWWTEWWKSMDHSHFRLDSCMVFSYLRIIPLLFRNGKLYIDRQSDEHHRKHCHFRGKAVWPSRIYMHSLTDFEGDSSCILMM